MNSTPSAQNALLITAFLASLGGAWGLFYFASLRRLKKWAEEEGVKILATRVLRSYDFYVTIEDKEKHVFNGWVNVGGITAVFRTKKPTVTWDDRPAYLKK